MDNKLQFEMGRTSEVKKATSPDEIIEQTGGCGRFQVVLSVTIHIMKTVIAFSLLGQIVILATPPWRCIERGDHSGDATLDSKMKDHSGDATLVGAHNNNSCANCTWPNGTVDDDDGVVLWSKQCSLPSGEKCSGFEFASSPRTLVSHFELVCDRAWVPATIMSIQMAGLCVGNVIAGQIADIFGRKKPLFFSMLTLFACNLMSFFSVNWVMYAVSRTLVGLGCGFFLSIQYNLMSEYSPSKWRSVVIGFPSYPMQASLVALVAWLTQDWKLLTMVISLMALVFLGAWFIVPESFRWHIGHDRFTEAESIVRRVAAFNKSLSVDNVLISPIDVPEPSRKYTIIDMFRTRPMLKLTLSLLASWFTIGFAAYGIGFGIQKLSGSVYLNLFLFNIFGIPSKLLTILIQNRFGRKVATLIALAVCGLGGLAVGIVQYIDIDEESRGTYTNYLALTANVGVAALWGALQTMTVEVYPTVIRSLSFGFLSTIARVGAIIGPQLVYLNDLVPGLLYFAVAFVCLLSICGTLCLPETRGAFLEDKIVDRKCKDTPAVVI